MNESMSLVGSLRAESFNRTVIAAAQTLVGSDDALTQLATLFCTRQGSWFADADAVPLKRFGDKFARVGS
jgi:NAD(P)H-dependent FMN reductase